MKKISFVSFYKFHKQNNIFDENSDINRDNILEPFIKLRNIFRQNGYDVNTEDITPISESDAVIFFRLDVFSLFKAYFFKKKCIYIQFEPPVVCPIHSLKRMRKIAGLFDIVFTWNDDLVDNIKFFKFFYPMPEFQRKIDKVPYQKKKFMTNISGYKLSRRKNELYSERIDAIKYFEQKLKSEFELFGTGWQASDFPSYRGSIENKIDVLKNYKFSLCYENESGLNGLLSEKIFDCFHARTVPIFLGAENVYDYIPGSCFIDRRLFNSYDELYDFLMKISSKEYNLRIESMEFYLQSDSFKLHSSENFAETVFAKVKCLNDEISYGRRMYSLLMVTIYKIMMYLKLI